MPTSNLAIWPEIIHAVHQVSHRRVLDVGPGHGKAAVLLREYLNDPPNLIDAVEAWQPYVGQFRLERLYDRCFVGDVTGQEWHLGPERTPWDAQRQLDSYDLVLMADVIEHLTLDAGIDLLARIPGRVVICTPTQFFDNDPTHRHPITEQHLSHWTEKVWDRVASAIRPLEVRYATLGGWIVRTGPLPQ